MKVMPKPLLVAGALLIIGALAGCKQAEVAKEVMIKEPVPVVVNKPVATEFHRRLNVSGNVEAVNYTLVSARVAGTLEKIYVDEGDRVVAGKTVLFQTDSRNLESKVEIAKRLVDVARCSVREREAARKQVKATWQKADLDHTRFKKLFDLEAATKDVLENQESRLTQATAQLEHADVLIQLAESEWLRAEANLAIAEKNLCDAVVRAPIDGVVTERLREPGEMANKGTPVLRIEDPNVVEVSAFLPAEFYAFVTPYKTMADVVVSGTDCGRIACTYKSTVIDPRLRTFEVKIRMEDPKPGVVPGGLAGLSFDLTMRPGLGVPAEAIIERGGEHVVFLIEGQQAIRRAVTIGLRDNGTVELIDFADTDVDVVIQGQVMLNDGDVVAVIEEGR